MGAARRQRWTGTLRGLLSPEAWTLLGFGLLALAGTLIRLDQAERVANFDIQSYWIVAELQRLGQEVYRCTDRYNYGPGWMLVLKGLLGPCVGTYEGLRMGVALLLAGVDVCLAGALALMGGWAMGLFFLLQPVSWVISGSHSQFDNVALLLFLGAVAALSAPPKAPGWLALAAFGVLAGLSMAFKHLALLFLPALLFQPWPWPKRLVAAFAPVALFYLSFAPFSSRWPALEPLVLGYQNGYIHSWWAHSPLKYLAGFGGPSPDKVYLLKALFAACMLALAWVWRRRPWIEQVALYLLAAFALQPMCALQYLAILALAVALRPTRWGLLLLLLCLFHLSSFYGHTSFPALGEPVTVERYKIQLAAVLGLAGALWPAWGAGRRWGAAWAWLHMPLDPRRALLACAVLGAFAGAVSGSLGALWMAPGLACLWLGGQLPFRKGAELA